jgi:hypothetical protein
MLLIRTARFFLSLTPNDPNAWIFTRTLSTLSLEPNVEWYPMLLLNLRQRLKTRRHYKIFKALRTRELFLSGKGLFNWHDFPSEIFEGSHICLVQMYFRFCFVVEYIFLVQTDHTNALGHSRNQSNH